MEEGNKIKKRERQTVEDVFLFLKVHINQTFHMTDLLLLNIQIKKWWKETVKEEKRKGEWGRQIRSRFPEQNMLSVFTACFGNPRHMECPYPNSKLIYWRSEWCFQTEHHPLLLLSPVSHFLSVDTKDTVHNNVHIQHKCVDQPQQPVMPRSNSDNRLNTEC